MGLYWLLRRAWYRHLWHTHQVNAGQFFDALAGAPPWLFVSTEPELKRAWRVCIGGYRLTRQRLYDWTHE